MLIIEDGTGVVGAESYVSASFADAYHLRMGNLSWPAPPDDTTTEDPNLPKKEAMLRRGAIWLDSTYGIRSNGIKKSTTQGLIFPQKNANYWNGQPIDSDSVPEIYKNAQCEVALLAYNGTQLFPTVVPGNRGLIRKKIDVLEWQWSEGAETLLPIFGWLDLMLAPLFGPPTEDGTLETARIIRT